MLPVRPDRQRWFGGIDDAGGETKDAMAAHLGSPMLDGEALSPELVLVCPELGDRARALLPERPQLWAERVDAVASAGAGVGSVDPAQVSVQSDDHDATQQRLEELTSLVTRIATDWQKIDARLVQLERAVVRMEAALAVAATPPAPWLEAQPTGDEEVVPLAPPGAEREAGTRTGLAGTVVVVAAVIAAMVAVELLPSLGERPRLAVVSEGAVPTVANPVGGPSRGSPAGTTGEAPLGRTSGTATAPTLRPAAPAAPTRATTSTIDRSDEPERATVPRTPPATAPTRTTTTPAARGRSRTAPSPPTRTSAPNDFTPARVFLWPAANRATLYAVTFFRNGSTFYSARVAKPRLVLPDSIRFTPGSYRWIVRPGTAGQPLRNPVVDSTFTVEPG